MGAYSGVHKIQGKNAIWLQGVGWVEAKPIEQFNLGEKIGYNYGSSGKILSVKPKGKKFHEVEVLSEGKKYKQKIKKGTFKPFFK